MRIRDLPQAIPARLLELDDTAQRLAADADCAEAALKEARRILSDLRPTGTSADRELPRCKKRTRSVNSTPRSRRHRLRVRVQRPPRRCRTA